MHGMPSARRVSIASCPRFPVAHRLGLACLGLAALVLGWGPGCTAPPSRDAQLAALSRTSPPPSPRTSEAVSAADLSRGIRAAPWAEEAPLPGVMSPEPLLEPETIRPEWVALSAWAHTLSLPVPVRLNAAADSWEITGPNGPLQILAGTRQARFDGMDLWLGYAPRPSPEGLLVHQVDLEKNLRPLITRNRLPPPAPRRIMLDPGHGGRSSGTLSVLDQRPEKEFVLDWALRLAPLLVAAGWEVFLTRTNDVDLTIADRVALTDAVRPDLFLSLHFNSAAPDLTRSGVETYCLTPVGLLSTLTRNYDDNPNWVLPNNTYDAANIQYAAHLHRALLRSTGAVDRGIRRARFMAVLQAQNCPAVLIEGGFLSNPREAARIATPAYRQLLAESIAAALSGDAPGPRGPVQDRIASP